MKRKEICFAGLLLAIMMLAACSAGKFNVRYLYGDTELGSQQVSSGQLPEEFEPEKIPGLRFVGWEETASPVTADVDYHGIFVPELTEHVPYLFPEENGFLRPDDRLTADECADALKALASDEAERFFPVLPEGSDGITWDVLSDVLRAFFPEAAGSLPSGTDAVSRSAFAGLMNTLIGREDELVQPDSNAAAFADVKPAREDFPVLMEAAIPHAEGSLAWSAVKLDTGYEPGWEVKAGRLRCYDPDGYLITDTQLDGGFQLDAEGFYTSGNEELDELVSERLAQFQLDNPKADRLALLRIAYDYCRDEFQYLRRPVYPSGAKDWEIPDAIEMLQTGKGNCYGYAAIFWAFARGLGYDVTAIAGDISGESFYEDYRTWPHGWVKLVDGETVYYFDPEMEMTEETQRYHECDLFMKEVSTFNWFYFEPRE